MSDKKMTDCKIAITSVNVAQTKRDLTEHFFPKMFAPHSFFCQLIGQIPIQQRPRTPSHPDSIVIIIGRKEMAKWGEGDPRWIVEERPDAINVNNWHWTEKNATPWSKDRLTALLSGLQIEKGPISVVLGDFQKLEGEATANNRKAKLIFLYEWEIEIGFKGRVAGSDTEYEGSIEIPNLSDENTPDEIDVNVTFKSSGVHEQQIRQLMNDELADKIRSQLAIYIKELKDEFSKGLILPTDKKNVIATTDRDKTLLANKSVRTSQMKKEGSCLKDDDNEKVDVTEISVKDMFKVPPDQLYYVLTQQEPIEKWTNGPAIIDLKESGKFSLFNGMVSGFFQRIKPHNELELKWRLQSYPKKHYAIVRMLLTDRGDNTELEIRASNVPASLAEDTRQGFQRNYIQNILRTFAFGAQLF